MNEQKILVSTNFINCGLNRENLGKEYHAMTSVISNFRCLIFKLGYDCGLLNDSEILSFEELIYEYEQGNKDDLIEVLEYLKK